MNTQTKLDLNDAREALESLLKQLPKMNLADKVDTGAKCKAMMKALEAIDEKVKEAVKATLGEKAGEVLGRTFKACMALIPTTRLNQKKLEAEQPKIYARYCETNDQKRITYEVR